MFVRKNQAGTPKGGRGFYTVIVNTAFLLLLLVATSTASPVFTVDSTRGSAPLAVAFTDKTPDSHTSRQWDFGDGQTSSDANPIHVYQRGGKYSVALTIFKENSSETLRLNNVVQVEATPTVQPAPTPDRDGTEINSLWIVIFALGLVAILVIVMKTLLRK